MKIPAGLTLLFLLLASAVCAQKSFIDYLNFYPIGEDPNIGYKTSYVAEETILFEANPIVRYSFYNNVVKGLLGNKEHVQAWYVSFRPQLRMYVENSLPVKTPSYRVFIGTQHLYRLPKDRFWGFSLESGHYSNGQSGCAFSEDSADGSTPCEEVYDSLTADSDLSEMLNRRSGNFSTNLTELILNYRLNQLDDDFVPNQVHSIKVGALLYHNRMLGLINKGGFTDQDIKLYGRFRFLLGYEYMQVLKKGNRFTLSENIELIQGAHQQVNPFRSELSFTYFPFKTMKELGAFVSYIYGHDNYNFRFVDAGHQLAVGFKWSIYPPFAIKSL